MDYSIFTEVGFAGVPARLRLSRQRGWRMPVNARKVDRTTRFGNPYRVEEWGQAGAVLRYALDLPVLGGLTIDVIRAELGGRSLACWCPPTEPCHSEVLLRVANPTWAPRQSRLYIAGPMTGLPDFNVAAFHAAAAQLRALGYTAINPAELNPDPTLDWHTCMRTDIRALVTCDALTVLPGWEQSRGANIEVRIARTLGLPVMRLADVVATSRARTTSAFNSAVVVVG